MGLGRIHVNIIVWLVCIMRIMQNVSIHTIMWEHELRRFTPTYLMRCVSSSWKVCHTQDLLTENSVRPVVSDQAFHCSDWISKTLHVNLLHFLKVTLTLSNDLGLGLWYMLWSQPWYNINVTWHVWYVSFMNLQQI